MNLVSIKEDPTNEDVFTRTFETIKEDVYKERAREKDLLRDAYRIKEPNYSFGKSMVVYWELMANGKAPFLMWVFVILEFMPLFWKGLYHWKEG